MAEYLKHKEVKGPKKSKPAKQVAPPEPVRVVVTGPDVPQYKSSPALQHDINYVAGLGGIEQALDAMTAGINPLTDIRLSTGFDSPVKVTLADNDNDDALERLLTAAERIADSLARVAGLSRPRLEQWHEQCEYEPRYRSSACDGGAPGPAKTE
jgi:hypothetical protein